MQAQPYTDWIGRQESRRERIHAAPLRALAATLDHEPADLADGAPLPPLAHWLFFVPLARASELGADGHARRGGFLPPVALPRRMWAGGRLHFDAPLRVGDEVTRLSTVESVATRRGRSGELVFVTVRHELTPAHAVKPAWTEWHDIVYREAAGAPAAPAVQAAPTHERADWQSSLVPDEVLLFRYSALTFNGHRIHYDRRHAEQVEGYPGLVVHGPLIATLLVGLWQQQHPGAALRRFEFRALAPAFDGRRLTLCGRRNGDAGCRLWALDDDGQRVMDARAA